MGEAKTGKSFRVPLLIVILALLFLSGFLLKAYFLENHFYLFLLIFFMALTATPLSLYLAERFEVYDRPVESRKLHHRPVPCLGGCAIAFCCFYFIFLFNNILSPEILGIAAGSLVIFTVGIVDDIYGIRPGIKLFFQIAAATLVVKLGISFSFFSRDIAGDVLGSITTVIWIVGITNAVNFFDGLDGLAAGIGVITSAFVGIVAYNTGDEQLFHFSLLIVACCLGFLPYNFKGNREAGIFLGDSGSTLIGFLLASFAIFGLWARNDPLKALGTPLLIFGVLVFDMLYINISRVTSGRVRSLGQFLEAAGTDHLHHRLLALGLSKKKSVFFIYFVSAVTGLNALVFLNQEDILLQWIILLQTAMLFLIVVILMRQGKKVMTEKNIITGTNHK